MLFDEAAHEQLGLPPVVYFEGDLQVGVGDACQEILGEVDRVLAALFDRLVDLLLPR